MRSVLVLVPLIAGCSVYAQHRAALVPHATGLPTDGQPMSSIAEVSVGADNLVDLIAPTKGDQTQGDVVPKEQLRGQAMFRIGRNFALGGVYEHAIAQNATVLSPSEPAIKDATLAGPGVQAMYSIETGEPGFRVGLATEIVFWNIPWVEYTSCIQNCVVPGYTYSDRGASVVPTLAFAIVPSYRTGPLTYFGGFTARNQPTITEKTITTVPDSDGDVQGGPFNITAHAGVAVELGAGVRASLMVHQTITRDPIAYGPGVGLMISLPLGRDQPRIAQPPPPPATGPRPVIQYVPPPAPPAPPPAPPPPAAPPADPTAPPLPM